MIVLVVYPTKLETFLSTPHGENFHVHHSMSHSYCMSSPTGAIYTNISDSESPNEALLTYGRGAPFAMHMHHDGAAHFLHDHFWHDHSRKTFFWKVLYLVVKTVAT